MYRVNNLLFVHTIFACIFGVKLENFPGGYAPLTPHFLWGAYTPQTPCSVIWKTPFKIPGYATGMDDKFGEWVESMGVASGRG